MTSPAPETVDAFRVIFACLTLLALLAAFGFGLKFILAKGWFKPASAKGGRLRQIESLPLDGKRRLTLVACDDKEYLLLLGNERETVVGSLPPKSVP